MAKAKPDGKKRVQNRHLYARLSYLQQTAHFLSTQQPQSKTSSDDGSKHSQDETAKCHLSCSSLSLKETHSPKNLNFKPIGMALSRELSAHTVAIARKSTLRLSPEMKRSICKSCSATLIDGRTSTSRTENESHNGQKPWADVLVITCQTCQMEKRFPVGQTKTKRREGTTGKKAAAGDVG
jgi:ribonuclease P protein subunit RPR2